MNLIQSNTKTMNSEELASLLNLRHDNVRQAAINLKSHGIITFTEISVKGNGRPKLIMQFDERNSIVIAAKLNDKLLAAVVDRWKELEKSNQPSIPQTYAAALLEAGRLAQALEETSAKLIEAQPKVEYHDTVLDSTNGITTSEIAAELGMSAQKLNKILAKKMIQKKVGGRWLLRAKHLNQGYDTEATYLDEGGNSRHAMKWTEKGRKFIHGLIEGVK